MNQFADGAGVNRAITNEHVGAKREQALVRPPGEKCKNSFAYGWFFGLSVRDNKWLVVVVEVVVGERKRKDWSG